MVDNAMRLSVGCNTLFSVRFLLTPGGIHFSCACVALGFLIQVLWLALYVSGFLGEHHYFCILRGEVVDILLYVCGELGIFVGDIFNHCPVL